MSANRSSTRRRSARPGASDPPPSESPTGSATASALPPVLVFFGVTYLITWSFFLGAYVLEAWPIGAALRVPLILLGSLAPSVVAIALTARASGRPGVRELLGRLLTWRVHVRWYVFALGYLAVVKLAGAVVHRVVSGRWPPFGPHSVPTILALIVLAGIVGGPLGEEIGWRGYALPRLADRFGLAPASLLLGLVWSCWHLPLFFLPVGGDQLGQSFPTYLLQVTALSVALAWLMRNTGGSLLLAVLMHSSINQTKDLVPSGVAGAHDPWAFSGSSVAWITVALLWLGAAFFLSRMSWQGRLSTAG